MHHGHSHPVVLRLLLAPEQACALLVQLLTAASFCMQYIWP